MTQKNYASNLPEGAEVRSRSIQEFRAAQDDGGVVIEGHAATFNEPYDLGPFREQIAPGAFEQSIEEDDPRALFNHDPNHLLGRQSSGTLQLDEDDVGLRTIIQLPESADHVAEAVQRGDLKEMSFGFEVLEESFEQDADGKELRTIERARVYDVSPTVFAANANTDVALRSLEAWRETRDEAAETAADGDAGEPEGDTEGDRMDMLARAMEAMREEHEQLRDLAARALAKIEDRQSRPDFEGTEEIVPDWVDEGTWDRPALSDHPEAEEGTDFDELEADAQDAIRGRFIEQDGDTYAELSNPVVNPATDRLNRNGVLAARQRPASEAAEQIADALWEEHFEDEENAGDPDLLMRLAEIEAKKGDTL